MLTWRDAEEEAERIQLEALWAPEPAAIEDIWALEEIELERTPLRRKLANALVQIGVKIDPSAADSLTSESAA